jgi:methionine aminopeptidase
VSLLILFFIRVQMNSLISKGIVDDYYPLNDIAGSYTAQFEHVGFSYF